MPFTLSHPGVVAAFWPLVRRNYLPLCALAIGAMSPDFEYLWRLRTEWRWSHAPLGILTFCVPVGLVTALLWVAVVRDPVRRLLTLPPAPLQLSAAWWIRAAIAIGVGAATHLVWDGFTHGSPWATQLVPGLRDRVTLAGISIPWFNLLQHASTVAGGLVVLGWLVAQLRRGEPRQLLQSWRLASFGAIAAGAAAVGIWNALRGTAASDYWGLQLLVSRAAVGALLGLAIALLLYGTTHRLVARAAP